MVSSRIPMYSKIMAGVILLTMFTLEARLAGSVLVP